MKDFFLSILECLKVFYNPSKEGLYFIMLGVATDKLRKEWFEFWLSRDDDCFHQTQAKSFIPFSYH